MYKNEQVFLQKNDTLFRVGQENKEFYIIEKGALEVYTEFEGNEFILERLP